jgi:hypothetical protein
MFSNICWDDFGKDWTIFTELGCANVLMLLSSLMIAIHTLITLIALYGGNSKKDDDYLVGAEDGCCGFLAIGLSAIAVDEPIKAKSKGAKRKAGSRVITIAIQVPVIVVCCSALSIINGPDAWRSQKTSVFAFVIVLLLHISNLVENIYEGVICLYD